MWLIGAALAADLTWQCPALDSPADALPYDPWQDLGVEAAGEYVYAVATGWLDDSCEYTRCALDECPSDLGPYDDCDCYQRSCTVDGAVTVWQSTSWRYDPYNTEWWNGSSVARVTVTPPPDGPYTWSALDVVVRTQGDWSYYCDSESAEWSASWQGTLRADWPTDGSFEGALTSANNCWSTMEASASWTDPSCAWSTFDEDPFYDSDGDDTTRQMTFDGHTLTVVEEACGGLDVAFLDGVAWGPVDENWELVVGTDDDGDGFSLESGDCDDDPTRNICVTEIWYDGIDQDCAGDDDFDADGDGQRPYACSGDDATTPEPVEAVGPPPPPAIPLRGCATVAHPRSAGFVGLALTGLVLLRRRSRADAPPRSNR